MEHIRDLTFMVCLSHSVEISVAKIHIISHNDASSTIFFAKNKQIDSIYPIKRLLPNTCSLNSLYYYKKNLPRKQRFWCSSLI